MQLFWWPLKVDDIFEYNWGTAGMSILQVIDVLDPIQRVRCGYLLTATVLEDMKGDSEFSLILGNTLIMRYHELVSLGTITLLSRRAKRIYISY